MSLARIGLFAAAVATSGALIDRALDMPAGEVPRPARIEVPAPVHMPLAVAGGDPVAVAGAGEPAPWEGLEADPPALPPPDAPVVDRPPMQPLRHDISVARLEAALALLDETALRVGAQLADSERAGDLLAAERARIRLDRLGLARARRAAELDRVRGGDLLSP